MDKLTLFAALFATFFTAHHVADYWIQTECQALHKHEKTWAGRAACAGHVAGHVITTGVLIFGLVLLLDFPVNALGYLTGISIVGVSHYVIDRRFTLRAFAGLVGKVFKGKVGYYDNGGAPFLDQSAHVFFLWLGALVAAALA